MGGSVIWASLMRCALGGELGARPEATREVLIPILALGTLDAPMEVVVYSDHTIRRREVPEPAYSLHHWRGLTRRTEVFFLPRLYTIGQLSDPDWERLITVGEAAFADVPAHRYFDVLEMQHPSSGWIYANLAGTPSTISVTGAVDPLRWDLSTDSLPASVRDLYVALRDTRAVVPSEVQPDTFVIVLQPCSDVDDRRLDWPEQLPGVDSAFATVAHDGEWTIAMHREDAAGASRLMQRLRGRRLVAIDGRSYAVGWRWGLPRDESIYAVIREYSRDYFRPSGLLTLGGSCPEAESTGRG